MTRPRIYLAGPDVFLPNAREVGAAKRRLCSEAGLDGVFPLDGDLALDGLHKHEQARLIYQSCVQMMHSCDAAIANLTPFRGVSADVGTAFEVGFMRALGRPVLGYSNAPDNLEARSTIYRAGPRLGFDGDADAVEVEDFDLADNLMIDIAIQSSGGRVIVHDAPAENRMADLSAFQACLGEMKRLLSGN